MTREAEIKEMRKVMRAKCHKMQEGGDCPEALACSQCEAEALYDAGYRKVELDKLTICASEGENPYPEMFRYPWSLGYEVGKLDQLAHTKREIGE